MNAKRLAEVLRAVAKRLDPPRSYADECEALRKELEAEAAAEFGLRNVQFSPDPASPSSACGRGRPSRRPCGGRCGG